MTALALTPDRLAREQQLCAAGWPYHPETPCARCGAAPNQECQMSRIAAPIDSLNRDPRTLAQAERDRNLPQLRATLERVEKAQRSAWVAGDEETAEDRRREAEALRWAISKVEGE